jgi:ABC-type glycerol-3-phosphate transport system substrate-binding protein
MKIKFGTAALALTFLLSACSSSSDKASSSAPVITCQNASEEDLKNINDGMISAKYRVESGFTADFNAEDIKTIKQVFPSYVSPKVFAAHIPSPDGRVVIGLWGIQKFDYGWRITALNDGTKKYSNLGADVSENSATGRVNAVMLELSANTNVISCIQKSRPPSDFPS